MTREWKGRLAFFFERCAMILIALLAVLTVVSFVTGGAPQVLAHRSRLASYTLYKPVEGEGSAENPAQQNQSAGKDQSAEKAQDDRFTKAVENLKERASAQQSFIGALATVTSLYAVILSFAAYFRLQQLKDETKESIEQSGKRFDRVEADLKSRFEAAKEKLHDLSVEVRAEIPAVHSIGQRLEELLIQLQQRFPVDGAWTNPDTYDRLPPEYREQVVIDEMVINSLDIFNIARDVGRTRTVSRLYVSLGQFYFVKAASHRRKKEPDIARSCLCRTTLYFDKAVSVDPTDAVALRGRGVSAMWSAMWLQEDTSAADYDAQIVARAKRDILASLKQDPDEPGALDGNAWLLIQEGNFKEAIKYQDKIIGLAPKLTRDQRKKYVLSAYLRRASYRVVALPYPPDPAAERIVVSSIKADCTEGYAAAKELLAGDLFIADLKNKVEPGQHLHALYTRHSDLKKTIDEITLG